MNENQQLEYYISNLRKYLDKNSINENTAKQIEFILLKQFTFIIIKLLYQQAYYKQNKQGNYTPQIDLLQVL